MRPCQTCGKREVVGVRVCDAHRSEDTVKRDPQRQIDEEKDGVSDERAERGEMRLDVGLTSLPSAGLVFTAPVCAGTHTDRTPGGLSTHTHTRTRNRHSFSLHGAEPKMKEPSAKPNRAALLLCSPYGGAPVRRREPGWREDLYLTTLLIVY